jgi:GT2 family glycosyltransferase
MPMPELVLYADDTEFSYRITKSGGQIWLLTEARLLELEASWNQKRRAQSSFEKWLTEGSELRVFYASRNQAYFDSNFWVRSTTLYRLNRFVYLMLLKLFSARCKCRERYALLRRAIGLGERGNLGIEPDFPLP